MTRAERHPRQSAPRAPVLAAVLCALLIAAACNSAARDTAAPGELGRPVDPVLATEPWSFDGSPGRSVRTQNYRIYTTEVNPVVRSRLPLFMESALPWYRSALGPLDAPRSRMDVFVMSSRPEWERLTVHIMGASARRYLHIQRGGFAAGGRALLFDIGTHDTFAIAAHEGWHQFTQRTFREPLPVWLEEGIATFMEGHRWDAGTPLFLGWANTERFDQLRLAAARAELLTLEQLLDASPQELIGAGSTGTLTYYAQVWALVHFLREADGGSRRATLETLVADAAAGRMGRAVAAAHGLDGTVGATAMARGPLVFKAYFGDDLARAGREYDEFVRRLVRTGSRHAIVAGRSPFEN